VRCCAFQHFQKCLDFVLQLYLCKKVRHSFVIFYELDKVLLPITASAGVCVKLYTPWTMLQSQKAALWRHTVHTSSQQQQFSRLVRSSRRRGGGAAIRTTTTNASSFASASASSSPHEQTNFDAAEYGDEQQQQQRLRKVTIIGGGMAGLGCLHALSPHALVTLVEASKDLGRVAATPGWCQLGYIGPYTLLGLSLTPGCQIGYVDILAVIN
jgi:hypothetical protein